MSIQIRFKTKFFPLLLCGVLVGACTQFAQPAHADDGWATMLLKPLVNSVILPAVNTSIDKLEAKIDKKSGQNAATTYTTDGTVNPDGSSATTSVPEPVATPSPTTNNATVPTTTNPDSAPASSATPASASLPTEPAH